MSAEKKVVKGKFEWPDKEDFSCPRRRALLEWCDDAADSFTIHGVSWFQRTTNTFLRLIILLYTIAVIIALPVFVIWSSAAFMGREEMGSNVEFQTTSNMTFPNITVCHPRYFDKSRMAEYGVNDTLVSYMTSILDMGYAKQYATFKNSSSIGDHYQMIQNQSEQELNRILRENNVTLLELFEAMAIRCDDFIAFCEIHTEFYLSPALYPWLTGYESCCGFFFKNEPFFADQGTCFTTAENVIENYPSSVASIRVWLNMNEDTSPGFSMAMRGSDAAERKGVIWTLSDKDHPLGVLEKDFNRVPKGTVTTVAMKLSRIDRTNLVSDECVTRNQTFEDIYGINITKVNCEMAHYKTSPYLGQNCSVLPYYRWNNKFNLRPCVPRDAITAAAATDPAAQSACLKSCSEREITYKTTTSKTYIEALDELVEFAGNTTQYFPGNTTHNFSGNAMQNFSSADITILQLYFSTFESPVYHLTEERWPDFLSTLGGQLGLLVGASVLSFAEIFYFLVKFLGIFLRTNPEKK